MTASLAPSRWAHRCVGEARQYSLVLAVLLAGRLVSTHAAEGGAPVAEDRVKAVFMYNFARFVEWPVPAATAATQQLVLGLWGRVSFQKDLQQAVSQAPAVGGRRLLLRQVGSLAEAGECHILFIAATERARVGELLAQLRGRPILTVSDMERFCEAGGMIGLRKKADTLGTDVNLAVAEGAGLKISAKLLRLSTIVPTAPP
jgi:hypothetical protein